MTQDEVDTIYKYLHEHYRYEDGELVVKKDRNSIYKKGHKLGDLATQTEGNAQLSTSLYINGANYNFRISHLVYLYFNKTKPKWIKHKDGNYMNNEIENLEMTDNRSEMYSFKRSIKKPQGFLIDKKCDRYVVQCRFNGVLAYIGAYKDKDIALQSYQYLDYLLKEKLIPHDDAIKLTLEKFPRPIRKNDTGFQGVHIRGNKFVAKFKNHAIGRFNTPEEAHQAYLKAKAEIK